MSADRSFWKWFGIAVAAVSLNTVFLFADIGRPFGPFEILRNCLWIPGIRLALVLPSLQNEEGGRGWGILMAAAIINWLFYSIVLFAIVFGVRRWRRKARAVNSSE
jgi:hypothetical protein